MIAAIEEYREMKCGRKVKFVMGYSRFSCTGYEDNRYNCKRCKVYYLKVKQK